MRGWIAALALIGGAAPAQTPSLPPPASAEPTPLSGCDVNDRANWAVTPQRLLELGQIAVDQVRLVRSGNSEAATHVSPDFSFGLFAGDLGHGSGRTRGIDAFTMFVRELGSGPYLIVAREPGPFIGSNCFPQQVTVTFHDASSRTARVVVFTFERELLISAGGHTVHYREGSLPASPSG